MLACSLTLLAFNLIPGFLHAHGAWPFYAVIFVSGIARSFAAAGATGARRRAHRSAALRERRRVAQLDLAVRRGRRSGARRIDLRIHVAARRLCRRRDHDGDRADHVLVDRLRGATRDRARTRSIGESLGPGLRFVFRESVLLSALTLDLFSVLLGGAEALLPVFADQILHVGPQGLGILRAAPAAGAVVASVYLAHRPPFKRAGRTLLYAVAVFALCIVGFGLSRSFYALGRRFLA